MITRMTAVNNLSKYVGKNLCPLAVKNGVTVVAENNNVNKGWKGLTLEKLAGLSVNSKKPPNRLGFELKSVCYKKTNNLWKPKETMAVCMINFDEILNHHFF